MVMCIHQPGNNNVPAKLQDRCARLNRKHFRRSYRIDPAVPDHKSAAADLTPLLIHSNQQLCIARK